MTASVTSFVSDPPPPTRTIDRAVGIEHPFKLVRARRGPVSRKMSKASGLTELLDRNDKDKIILVVMVLLGDLILYQHYCNQKAVELISLLSNQLPGTN